MLELKDLSPLDREPTSDENAALERLAAIPPSECVVPLRNGAREQDGEPLAGRWLDGRWWAGRYIGSAKIGDQQISIGPRLGFEAVGEWLADAFNVSLVPKAGRLDDSDQLVPWLLALVWNRHFDAAARHGSPSMRRRTRHSGTYARGRIRVRETQVIRARGRDRLISEYSERTLDNDVSRTLVCAERTLNRLLSGHDWQSERVREVMPQLRSAVGPRPLLPRSRALRQIRYSPIRLPYKHLVNLSHRIASRRGLSSVGEHGDAEALFIDVAELWELFIARCASRAFGHTRVSRETRESRRRYLMQNSEGAGLGWIIPDVVVNDARGEPSLIVDAKYKRLARSRERPTGVDRGDLYQLASYLSRYPHAAGMLAYPDDPNQAELARAEIGGPWMTKTDQQVEFRRLPITAKECVDELKELGPA